MSIIIQHGSFAMPERPYGEIPSVPTPTHSRLQMNVGDPGRQPSGQPGDPPADRGTSSTRAGARGSAAEVAERLRKLHLANLTTVSPSGWPIAHCMHFLDLVDERGAPLIYMFTHYGTRKLLNVAHSPRVALSFCSPEAPPAGLPIQWLRLQGSASLVMDLVERRQVKAVNHARQGFTTQLDLDRQPLVRVDVDAALYTDADGGVRVLKYPQSDNTL